MTLALLAAGLLLSQPPVPPSAPPPPPTVQEYLQVRAELEDLRLERAQLLRRIAELRGLVEYLSGPDVEAISARRKALDAALAAAGLTRTEHGQVVPLPPAKGTQP